MSSVNILSICKVYKKSLVCNFNILFVESAHRKKRINISYLIKTVVEIFEKRWYNIINYVY